MYAGFFGCKDFAVERVPRVKDEGVEVRRRFERRLEGW